MEPALASGIEMSCSPLAARVAFVERRARAGLHGRARRRGGAQSPRAHPLHRAKRQACGQSLPLAGKATASAKSSAREATAGSASLGTSSRRPHRSSQHRTARDRVEAIAAGRDFLRHPECRWCRAPGLSTCPRRPPPPRSRRPRQTRTRRERRSCRCSRVSSATLRGARLTWTPRTVASCNLQCAGDPRSPAFGESGRWWRQPPAPGGRLNRHGRGCARRRGWHLSP